MFPNADFSSPLNLNSSAINTEFLTNAIKTDKAIISAVNAAKLETIRALDATGGNEILCSIIGLYLDNSLTLLNTLEKAWSTGEVDTIRSVSHTLKSSSNQIGAEILGELCREVEHEARNNNSYDTSGKTLLLIKEEFSNTRDALQAYLM